MAVIIIAKTISFLVFLLSVLFGFTYLNAQIVKRLTSSLFMGQMRKLPEKTRERPWKRKRNEDLDEQTKAMAEDAVLLNPRTKLTPHLCRKAYR